jgi:hypothetical protein
VWRGAFAEQILKGNPSVGRYMVDPWQHLDHWNKPANVSNRAFDHIFEQAMTRTGFAGQEKIVLPAKTSEAVLSLADAQFDGVYIDSDLTLRCITMDLVSTYDRISSSGLVFDDDIASYICKHYGEFEQTFVLPLAVYFVQARGGTIYGLPFNRFLIAKSDRSNGFHFYDLTQRYDETTLRRQFAGGPKRPTERFVNRLRTKIVCRLAIFGEPNVSAHHFEMDRRQFCRTAYLLQLPAIRQDCQANNRW